MAKKSKKPKLSQVDKIITYLSNNHKSITKAEARKRFGVTNLTARICDVRVRGFEVRRFTRKTGNRKATAYAFNYAVDLSEVKAPYNPASSESAWATD